MIQDINKNLLEVIYDRVLKTYPILFARNSREEIQSIIFYDQKNSQSPRIHYNEFYQENIWRRIDQIYNNEYIMKSKFNLKPEQEPGVSYKSKKEYHRAITKPFNSV